MTRQASTNAFHIYHYQKCEKISIVYVKITTTKYLK